MGFPPNRPMDIGDCGIRGTRDTSHDATTHKHVGLAVRTAD